MFLHKKVLIHDIHVREPNPTFAQLLLEQFGGATGELTAALQYYTQSFHCEDPAIRDMLQDIATEEFSHLEVVGRLIEAHTKGFEPSQRNAAFDSTLFAVRGIGPHLLDSQGQAWTAAYVNEGADVVRDLRANIAAEAGARQTYEALVKQAPDEGTKEALVHLLTREIAHTRMFMEALRSLGKLDDPLFGTIAPDPTVDIYFNLSKGPGPDERGPWNEEPNFTYVANPEDAAKMGESPTSGTDVQKSKRETPARRPSPSRPRRTVK